MANVIRNIGKLKIRMAKWLGLNDSDFNLTFNQYFTIANKRGQPWEGRFSRRFDREVMEIYEFRASKTKT